MRKTYSLVVTKDRTVRVKVGRQREYVSMDNKSKGELFEAVKYALLSKDAFISEIRLIEDLRELGVT